MSLEQLKTRYTGQTAATYNQQKHLQAHFWVEQETVSRMLTEIRSEQTGSVRVLDVPVGTGRFLRVYRELEMQVLGCDVSRDMLQEARREAEKLRSNAELREADVTNLPLQDSAVDVVVCMRFLNHLELDDLERVLVELLRVTRSDVIATAGSRTAKGRTSKPNPSVEGRGSGSRTLSKRRDRLLTWAVKGWSNPIIAVRSLIRKAAGKSGYTADDVVALFNRYGLTIIEKATITDSRRAVTDDKREYFIFHLRKPS